MAQELKEIDLEIIRHLYNLKGNETITTYSLAKKLFDGREIKNKNRFYTDKAKHIDYRMKKLSEARIIDISQSNGKKMYTLILNNVKSKVKTVRIQELKLKIDGNWETFIR